MNKKLLFLLFTVGFTISMINSCNEENDQTITNIYLLTNDSSKIWLLSEIVVYDSMTIVPPPCFVDDEIMFCINGKCMIDNMSTIYIQNGFPPFCKDTIDIIEDAFWNLNSKMDTLTITSAQYVLIGKILKLTNDSLILRRTYIDSFIQTEYFVAKKQ